ncbi:salicylate synthase [Xylanibacillus composti]|uniref:Salicylate synthase n=1 Tax=Xylanibacillus composti TaxID=1572762 RepID=A0A8J4H640_9BACL|nr:salicylate synthase [Xylanibacillus composti]MDT9724554.1 salicylate synthase [Xylanibacillus composti]GIQ70287.1 hypothetical protein XYCOK13_31110 [Xylanibacillus composti]
MWEDRKQVAEAASKYEQLGYWEPLTLGQHLHRWAERYRDSVALVEGDSRLTYRELDGKADELASGLYNMGIKKGDHVVVQLPNRISFVVVCFALFRIGALPILALPAHRETELDGIFQTAEPVAYIAPDVYLGFDYRPMANRLAKRHPSVRFVITDGDNESGVRLADIGMPPVKLEQPAYRDIALLLLSGGTTGIPKLIPRTHADYAYNAKAAATRCNLKAQSVYLAVLPVAHNFPLCCPGILGTLSVGGKVVMCQTSSCDEALPLIAQEKVTITALVPSLASMWLDVLEWDRTSDISSLEVLQIGGAMLEEQLARRIMPEMGCKLQQVFGMAEGLICCTSLDDTEQIIQSCQGRPLSADDEILLVDEEGNEVETGEYGELLVRGPYTINGYYRAPEQNRKAFTPDGFYRSGDRARVTAEGNIQIGGRIKEQINRAGEKIVPSEVESWLCAHPDIQDAVLIGLPDARLGERSCACLMTGGKEISLAEIHRFLQDKGVARYKMPDQIVFVDVWPLTGVGKIDKAKLKKLAAGSERQAEDNRAEYLEETVDFKQDAHIAAAQAIESGLFDTFLLYENGDELSLGMGVHAMITVKPDCTTVTTAEETLQFENRSLSETMGKAFSSVSLRNWRAYGIANFELSRYHYDLPLPSGDACLMQLFVPQVELRFANGTLVLRAVNRELFQEAESLAKRIANSGRDEDSASRLAGWSDRIVPEISEVDTHDAEAYMKMVEAAVEEIRQRNYHKVILSRKIPLRRELDMVASYIAGRRANTPARSFLLSLDGLRAAGFSPETVVEVDDQGWASTFPLAGTRATGSSVEEASRLREELLRDPKEIAEHAVSVKLAFEEMERICASDTIVVHEFMSVASRGTVQHIASRLKGKLKSGFDAWHAFHALFPAVTACGIPKKPSIDAIGRLETEPRNLYSGCVMTVDSNGAMDAALVLRTIFQKEKSAWLQAGAGIVEMSNPSRELEETREKLSSVSKQLVAASVKQEVGGSV